MKTNSPNRKKSYNKGNIIFGKLDKKIINKIAKRTGFVGRNDGKIKPLNLIIGFMSMVSKGLKTYESWASEISTMTGISLSKQAIDGRMNSKTENMLKLIFKEKLTGVLNPSFKERNRVTNGKFRKIIIDDSTTINLPDELEKYYPGNVSRGKKKAQAKIHALYNFTENNFLFLNVHNYRENDQSLSPNVLPHLKAGDLILRDLGFQTLSVQKQLINRGVFYISRKNFQTKVYDIKTGKEINLLKFLRKNPWFDKEVLVGTTERVKMRLVIAPISKEHAAERRRKERKNRDKRLNHNLQYYELLGYSISLTNIPKETCSIKEIGELYSLRWRIETIFKAWKSHFSLEKIIPNKCKKPERINCLLYLMLLFITLFQTTWINYCIKNNKSAKKESALSLIKMAKFYNQHLLLILLGQNGKLNEQLSKQCRYEKRNDRLNTIQKYEKLAA